MDGTTRRTQIALGLGATAMFSAMIAFEFMTAVDYTMLDVAEEVLMLGLLVGTTVTTALLVSRMRVQEERSIDLQRELVGVHARNQQWQAEMAEHVRELGSAIQRQFVAWGLTPSEQEVGLLLLKGFSHKEIARLRSTSEATIRQQAASVYQKSGLAGRAGLSAYFLEELMLPESEAFRRAAE